MKETWKQEEIAKESVPVEIKDSEHSMSEMGESESDSEEIQYNQILQKANEKRFKTSE